MENDKKDVKEGDDMEFSLKNMIAGEDHCLVAYSEKKDEKYLDISQEVRRFRSKLMYLFVKQTKEPNYCITKHLLASACGLKELANRYIETENRELAKECIDEANLFEKIVLELNEIGGK